jgi:PAS domain S-box-containing protein
MKHFTQSLRFKLTLLVIAVELLIFSGAGVFYTHRFSQEIDNAIIARLSIPGLLMSRGELSFDAVSDKRTMEGLLREPYSEGVVIGLDGQVYFSSNPARLETQLVEIDGLRLPRPEASTISVDALDLITPVQDSTGTYLTCLSPLRPDGKLTGYLYLKVGTEISEAEKRKIVILFAIGSLGAIALTAAILSWLLNLMVIRRLNNLVEVFPHFARGDYAVRAQPSGDDEIATLGQNFNAMMEAIQGRENDLHRVTLFHRTILANVAYGIISTTPEGVVTSFNSAAERLLGYAAGELIGKQTPALWHDTEEIVRHAMLLSGELGETVTPGFDVFAARPRRNLPEDNEWTFIRKDGRRIPVNLSVTALWDGSGQITGFVGLAYDLTERKRAEEALRLSSERLHLATRVANIGIWDWDIPKNELVWDDSMYQLYGIRKEDFGGAYDAWISTIYPDDKAYTDGEIQAALRGEREYAPEFRIVRPDGSIRHIKADSRTTRDREGKPLRMIGTNIDITELKQAEMEIRTLNRELEQRVAERTAQLETAVYDLENFNYSASHDLRIPLRAIDGFSKILLDEHAGQLDDEAKRLLSIVRNNTKRMELYIDDMLTFSRAGRTALALDEVDMEELAREVMDEIRPGEGEIELDILRLPRIFADRAMMRQVFVCLLSNAIKFSRPRKQPRIEVGASIEGSEIIYYVKDNGVGFDMRYAGKLFGVFERLHSVTEFEGNGIGLAIFKRIVNRHGGRVWAEGKVDEGATVYFALPIKEKDHG